MSDTDPLNVMRRRRESVTGVSRMAGSWAFEWMVALIGWPPQPVCWQIWPYILVGLYVAKFRTKVTILYMGTEPYDSATVPRMTLRV